MIASPTSLTAAVAPPAAPVAAAATPAVSVRDLTVAYRDKPVLWDVELEIPAGSLTAIIGPNGAGKSTLIKAALGLVPAAAGTIEFFGRPYDRQRRLVGYVPQRSSVDWEFPTDALDVVTMGTYGRLGWLRRPGRADKAIAMRALERVGLAGRRAERFGILSGGQRQRVLLARAMAQEAELLLLDEPFGGVDATTTDLLIDVLGELRGAGVAVVMSTHDLAVAHLACDNACLLNRHQVAFGPIADALTPDLLRETYGASAVVLAGGSTILTAQ